MQCVWNCHAHCIFVYYRAVSDCIMRSMHCFFVVQPWMHIEIECSGNYGIPKGTYSHVVAPAFHASCGKRVTQAVKSFVGYVEPPEECGVVIAVRAWLQRVTGCC